MTSSVFALYLTCLFLGEMAQMTDLKFFPSVHQSAGFVAVKTGGSLTLQCFYEHSVAPKLFWYKQSLGQKPKLISTYYKYDPNATFYNEFKNNPRFTLNTENGKNHLTITDLRFSDSATYYCFNYVYTLEFAVSIIIHVKGSGSNVSALVHQSASESIQPGGSVTLNCTVHTGSCDGGHRVYWFKQSEEPHPGLIYTHGDGNDQCERKPDTQTHTCKYNLPMENLNLSHAGTYYCAVASCGHVLFGNGTKLDVENEVHSIALVYFLSVSLMFTCILVVLLVFIVCKLNKRNSCQPTESQARFSTSPTAHAEGARDTDNLHYAALSVNLPNRSRRHRNTTNDECVYSGVKL